VPGAIAVVEERAGAVVELPADFREFDKRRYGDTEIRLARYQPA
jgi:hypothetical protein